jgi:hypothetical protein
MLTEGWSVFTALLAAGLVWAGVLLASRVMSWASDRSPLWNMVFAGVVGVFVMGGAVLLAWLLAQAAFR